MPGTVKASTVSPTGPDGPSTSNAAPSVMTLRATRSGLSTSKIYFLFIVAFETRFPKGPFETLMQGLV
ncbi:MAG: hypothetical protein A49_03990 [Methyloceanibacter sp.]|nr:MAG: hypothetical protein A49_03990 [Methyloceanibacter sp.]